MNKHKLVDMNDVIGVSAAEYGIIAANGCLLSFEALVKLGFQASKAVNLESDNKHISFDMLCEAIKQYIDTPFGYKQLNNIYAEYATIY